MRCIDNWMHGQIKMPCNEYFLIIFYWNSLVKCTMCVLHRFFGLLLCKLHALHILYLFFLYQCVGKRYVDWQMICIHWCRLKKLEKNDGFIPFDACCYDSTIFGQYSANTGKFCEFIVCILHVQCTFVCACDFSKMHSLVLFWISFDKCVFFLLWLCRILGRLAIYLLEFFSRMLSMTEKKQRTHWMKGVHL